MSIEKKYYNDTFQQPIKIDIGCGPWKKEGFLGIDNYLGEGQWNVKEGKPIDINHDLSKGIPFEDNTVDEVFASHFLEHTDLDFMLQEINRVLKPGGKLEFIVPYANSAEGMFPGHNVFLTEKFFKHNTAFNHLFKNAHFSYTPSDDWEGFRKYIFWIPFRIARKHFFNVCRWFTVECRAKK